jgi:hypothetical protein
VLPDRHFHAPSKLQKGGFLASFVSSFASFVLKKQFVFTDQKILSPVFAIDS